MPSRRARHRIEPLSEIADRHRLYELAVQDAGAEVAFVDRTFRRLRGRPAETLREDFCGTAAVCGEWVRTRRSRRAWGVDLNAEVLDWGRRNNLSRLTPEQAARVKLLQDDVMLIETETVDALLAMNFSYWTFKDRPTLGRYFRRAHDALGGDGVLFLDAFGGYDAFRELEEPREIDEAGWRFTYIWDQARFDPGQQPPALPHPLRVPRPVAHRQRLHLRLAVVDPAGAARTAGRGRVRPGHRVLAGLRSRRRAERALPPGDQGRGGCRLDRLHHRREVSQAGYRVPA